MGNFYLSERIGDPVLMVAPVAHATDLVATDHAGVPIRDAQGVLFILTAGVFAGDSATVAITYASDGVASNASASSDVWASSNMTFTAVDSDSENSNFMLDLDLSNSGIDPNANGKFYCTGENVGDPIYSLIGIPYNLNRSPATNAQTVLRR